MCGFAGLIAWDERYRIDRQTLSRMTQAIAHRGPDGQDLRLIDPTPASPTFAALGFARLAILDLDPRAMQPMTDGRRWLLFNGEIFNFRELRRELEQIDASYAWRTAGDSEVILRAYDAWQENCLPKLDGMFAIAIWDPQTGELFLARDRMGQKPLYVAQAPAIGNKSGAVAFASELAALQPLDWPDRRLCEPGFAAYLQLGCIPAPRTIYRGITKLTASTWQKFSHHQPLQSGTYFDCNKLDAAEPSGAIAAARIRQAVQQAVARQLVSDVPVGCFLSGGIDSSAIALAMSAAADQSHPVQTFSIGFDDPLYDETQYAQSVAAHLHVQHRHFIVRPDAATDLPKLAAVFGEPFADSSALAVHYLARETRPLVKVALSGDGGDELFGGYDRYRAMTMAHRAQQMPKLLRRVAQRIPGQHPKSRAARLRRFLQTIDQPAASRYAGYLALFDEAQIAALAPDAAVIPNLIAEEFTRQSAGRDDVQAAAATDRVLYLGEDVLTKVDRASMLHALEVRSPFLDPELIGLCAGLTRQQMLEGGPKRLLREAFAADLPRFVFRRRKMGFAVPVGNWLREELRPMLLDLLGSKASFARANLASTVIDQMLREHQSQTRDHGQRLYALLMLELWHQSVAGAR